MYLAFSFNLTSTFVFMTVYIILNCDFESYIFYLSSLQKN